MNTFICILVTSFWVLTATEETRELHPGERFQVAALLQQSATPWLTLKKPVIPPLLWPLTKSTTSDPRTTSSPLDATNGSSDLSPDYPDFQSADPPFPWKNQIKGVWKTAAAQLKGNVLSQVTKSKVKRSAEDSSIVEEEAENLLSVNDISIDNPENRSKAILNKLQFAILKIINNFLIGHNIEPIEASNQVIDLGVGSLDEASKELAEVSIQKVVPPTTTLSPESEELEEDEDEILKMLPPNILKILRENAGIGSSEEVSDEVTTETPPSTIGLASGEVDDSKEAKISLLAALLKKFIESK